MGIPMCEFKTFSQAVDIPPDSYTIPKARGSGITLFLPSLPLAPGQSTTAAGWMGSTTQPGRDPFAASEGSHFLRALLFNSDGSRPSRSQPRELQAAGNDPHEAADCLAALEAAHHPAALARCRRAAGHRNAVWLPEPGPMRMKPLQAAGNPSQASSCIGSWHHCPILSLRGCRSVHLPSGHGSLQASSCRFSVREASLLLHRRQQTWRLSNPPGSALAQADAGNCCPLPSRSPVCPFGVSGQGNSDARHKDSCGAASRTLR